MHRKTSAQNGTGVAEVIAGAFIAAGLAALAHWLFAPAEQEPPDTLAYSLISARGTTRLDGGPVPASGPLAQGATFSTGPDSLLNLRLADGSTLQLAENSKLVVEKATASPDRKSFDNTLKLDSGEVISKIPKASRGIKRRTELKTPSVSLGVRGTEFAAAVDPGRARTMVTRGEVELLGAHGPGLPLRENFGTVTETGRAPEPPTPLPPPPRLQGPEDGQWVTVGPVQLAWNAAPGASGYLLEVADDKGAFDSIVLRKPVAGTSVTLDEMPFDADFSWRVATVDARGLRGKGSTARLLKDRRHHRQLRDLAGQGRIDDALGHASPALRNFRDDGDVLTDVGRVYYLKGDYATARDYYDLAVAARSPSPNRFVLRGYARLRLADLDGARADFSKALELAPRDADAYAGLGDVDWAGNNPDPAGQNYRTAIDLDPRHPSAHLGLARVLLKAGDRRGAHRQVDLHLEITPGEPEGEALHQQVR